MVWWLSNYSKSFWTLNSYSPQQNVKSITLSKYQGLFLLDFMILLCRDPLSTPWFRCDTISLTVLLNINLTMRPKDISRKVVPCLVQSKYEGMIWHEVRRPCAFDRFWGHTSTHANVCNSYLICIQKWIIHFYLWAYTEHVKVGHQRA